MLTFITSGNADDLSLVSSGNFEVFLLPGIGSAAFGFSIRGSFGWGVLLQVMWVESSPSCLPSCYLFHIE